ncbi:MAG: GDP-L-fucose synthase [Verrucomicrobiota bacterium]|jgi:GDP-L-fucose synthase|nr:GDP-L-fucose synthase [Verrucomicrobiota bacterium]
MERNSKIYIAGHSGLVGGSIRRSFERHGCTNLIGRTHGELDLTNQQAVNEFFAAEKPEYVILAAAKVGGIQANNLYRGQFIYENTMIEMNVIHAAHRHGVKKLLFLGSSCIYPKRARQPIKEEALLTGPLEPTNEPYAIAKIVGIRLCDACNRQYGTNFISAMPTNLYGPGDNYHPENSHVLPAMIRKIHLAKSLEDSGFDELRRVFEYENRRVESGMLNVERKGTSREDLFQWLAKSGITQSASHLPQSAETRGVTLALWGSGTPLREFLYSDDLAEACVFLVENANYEDLAFTDDSGTVQSHINVGSGEEVTIRDLAETVRGIIGFEGKITWDTSKPDGTPRKLMDSSRMKALGWKPKVSLREGIRRAYEDFLRRFQ